MLSIVDFFKRVENAVDDHEQSPEEEYLSGAANLYELEARIRAWDRHQSEHDAAFVPQRVRGLH